jgi:adhesin transport system membrane fusion protein
MRLFNWWSKLVAWFKNLIFGNAHDDSVAETPGITHARLGKPNKASFILMNTIGGLMVLMLIWAAVSSVDEVTHAEGRVIPSAKMQVLQNMEGGIVQKINVKQGDLVQAGQVLMNLSSTQFGSEFEGRKQQVLSLMAKEARLLAEVEEKALVFSPEFTEMARQYVNIENAEFINRRMRLSADLAVLENQYRGALAEVEIIRRLVERGLEPQLELIRTQARVDEARTKIDAMRRQAKSEASGELAKVSLELQPMRKQLPALADKVERTYVKAPMKGVVNRVLVTTIGGVLRPGEPLMEIVPSDDVLVVEAQVRPQDIGFVKLGQSAQVKVTAYDYSIFGSMMGRVTQISADAVSKEERGQTNYYYIARVETSTSVMNSLGKKLPIIPGMQAQVDIITGNKTVLNYLLKPLIGVKENAFRER